MSLREIFPTITFSSEIQKIMSTNVMNIKLYLILPIFDAQECIRNDKGGTKEKKSLDCPRNYPAIYIILLFYYSVPYSYSYSYSISLHIKILFFSSSLHSNKSFVIDKMSGKEKSDNTTGMAADTRTQRSWRLKQQHLVLLPRVP
jgi:hypothetical protein